MHRQTNRQHIHKIFGRNITLHILLLHVTILSFIFSTSLFQHDTGVLFHGYHQSHRKPCAAILLMFENDPNHLVDNSLKYFLYKRDPVVY